ncbi:EamA family transporter [Microbacterium sp. MMO-10]|uniref:EamA family transporter n=1 Tax=Microbacterium sp. MMO-10 TaxID=3081272 RepID=UPI0030178F92
MPAVLALVAAFIFGSADFIGGFAAKTLRSLAVTAVSALSGLLAMVVVALVARPVWHPDDVLWAALSGVSSVAAVALLYGCLAIGPMSILSPLGAVVAAIGPVLWGLLVNGEQLTGMTLAGLALALTATVLVGFIPGQKVVRPTLRGVLMAIGSGLGIGVFMIVMSGTHADAGVAPLIVNRGVNALLCSLFVVGVMIAARRRGQRATSALVASGPQLGATPSGRADLEHARPDHAPRGLGAGDPHAGAMRLVAIGALWATVGGVVDAIANALTIIALRSGDLGIVAALTSMYPAGTILLAAVVLRERIAPVQWAGLVLALLAAVLFALPAP